MMALWVLNGVPFSGEGRGLGPFVVEVRVATLGKWHCGGLEDLEGAVLGCSVPESSRRYAAEQHFASALAKPSSSTHDFEVGTGSWRGDHPWKMAGRSRQYSDRHHSTMLALGALP